MSQFEQYISTPPSISPKITKYIVIDSEQQVQQQTIEMSQMAKINFSQSTAHHTHTNTEISKTLVNSTVKPLSNKQTNIPLIGLDKNIWSKKDIELGFISSHIKARKQQKTKIEYIRNEINKAQSQCQALETLIQKMIKKQAELLVKKHHLQRNTTKQAQKQRQERKSVQKVGKSKAKQRTISQSFDISKTIKNSTSLYR